MFIYICTVLPPRSIVRSLRQDKFVENKNNNAVTRLGGHVTTTSSIIVRHIYDNSI